jgi:hypothetical protein
LRTSPTRCEAPCEQDQQRLHEHRDQRSAAATAERPKPAAGHSTNYEHGSGMTAQRIIIPMSSICDGSSWSDDPFNERAHSREALVCGVTG